MRLDDSRFALGRMFARFDGHLAAERFGCSVSFPADCAKADVRDVSYGWLVDLRLFAASAASAAQICVLLYDFLIRELLVSQVLRWLPRVVSEPIVLASKSFERRFRGETVHQDSVRHSQSTHLIILGMDDEHAAAAILRTISPNFEKKLWHMSAPGD